MNFPAVELNNQNFDVEIITTRNRNAYARVKNGSILISLPSRIKNANAEKIAEGLYNRIRKQMLKTPERFLYNDKKEYITFEDNQSFTLLGKNFTFHITNYNKESARGSVAGNEIKIKIPETWEVRKKTETVSLIGRKLLTRALKNDMLEYVKTINNQHFNSSIKNVTLTNASTRWGSCSTRRNSRESKIFLNFKLLFMPQECLDYVIMHELAHTIEPSHSKKFWGIVGNAMPDYKERRKLLKQSAYKLKSNSI